MNSKIKLTLIISFVVEILLFLLFSGVMITVALSNAGMMGEEKMTGFNTSGIYIAIRKVGTVNPTDYALLQNYPNPFNPLTVINYQLPNTSNVKLSIYDMRGQEVNILVNETQIAGNYEIGWNASAFPSGVYFYRLEAGSFVSNKKMILIK